MNSHSQQNMTLRIIEKAKSLGTSLAGLTDITSLQNAPSYHSYDLKLPQGVKSVLVLALEHNEDEPELDWWGAKGGTIGNQKLQEISNNLRSWLGRDYNIQAQSLPYHVEKGGIFLKDAAVQVGIGILGVNNLLVTPEFGPRVRLRALFLAVGVIPAKPLEFSPCDTCNMPCKRACPQNAFSSGSYNRILCANQMKVDEDNKVVIQKTLAEDSGMRIKYCRACELACPVGQK